MKEWNTTPGIVLEEEADNEKTNEKILKDTAELHEYLEYI